ncbi:ABC transporter permease [Agromyces sp. H3Y2-19a]|uniref:ABC transporter permease n=1 Tax=Agromyces chromiiresistens TaxID=3030835 RepID=UPI0023B97A77|nr:ABC transporter permease [Agromyces chromiiresistens]MDF0514596.1 ABC transporter permease [Agromyces chromiiresistens]
MSTVTEHQKVAPPPDALAKTVVVSWKAPIAYGIFTLLTLALAVFAPRDGDTTYRLIASDKDAIKVADISVPAMPALWTVVVLLAVITAVSVWLVASKRRVPLWLTVVYAVLFLFGFLTWAGAGATLPMIGLLYGALSLSVPLIFGALTGVLGERVGIINIAIEGQLLAGAFTSAVTASVVTSSTGVVWIGLLSGVVGAMIAGMLVGMVLAAFSIKYFVDQVIVGVVLNVLVTGLTSFFFSQVLSNNAAVLNSPPRFPRLPIPLLSDIPVIGPVFFRQTLVVYIMYIAVAAVYVGLFHTRWGLRLRAVGEHPQAADTVGINVNRTRFWNVAFAGAIAGFGGIFFTLGSGIAFNKEMTAGMGFIALAAVIFGGWDPIRATLAALLFGFASNLQNTLSVIGSPVPSEFMLMLPYVVTIIAVAGLVGKVRGPAAAGKPYIKS